MPMLNKSLQKDNIGFYMITHKSTNLSFQLFLIPGFYSVSAIFVCIYVILSIFTCLLVFYYCSSKIFYSKKSMVIRQCMEKSLLRHCVRYEAKFTILTCTIYFTKFLIEAISKSKAVVERNLKSSKYIIILVLVTNTSISQFAKALMNLGILTKCIPKWNWLTLLF